MLDRNEVVRSVDLTCLADQLLGPRRGSQRSPTWRCPAEAHAQTGRTPPVSVFWGRRGEQRWTCHGCGAGGTAVDLVMAVHGLGVRPALEYLAGFAGRVIGDPSPPTSVAAPGPDPRALVALHRYVRECAHRLWRPSGATVREWLTRERRLPADVLRANVVGADPGPGLQPRPAGVPRRAGAVFPVLDRGRVVYAQLRRLRATGDQPRYLSVGNRLAPRPAVAFYRAVCQRDDTVVVTEGPVDALAAAAAGFDAVALLGTGGAGAAAAQAVASLARPAALALDADGAGRAATARLAAELTRLRSPSRVVGIPPEAGDVAGWLASVHDWPAVFGEAVAVARPARRAAELAR